ncbi:DNA cross-link repair protein PSO2/SNM1 [Microsporum canis]|uniref:DNA cross-link repair protein pso2/snm1 n=1 Tax=Arthroderma otae (strain ATCC MYA-4605 / CBS 113480) TaxID=554155 RepID=C5FYP1_ARTOC|nr:DNA cross-link repair protein pso2/snm1 [Microsporum canis CBS 113480]EEQ34639.1 DNA cross-link repair protein pso2/snm1 [Microsporum canis CBS 113480]
MPPTLTSPFFRPNGQTAKRPSPLSTVPNKPAPKRNGSILNFFKKSDAPPKSTQPRITEYGIRSRGNSQQRPRLELTNDSTSGLFFEDAVSNNSGVEEQTKYSSFSEDQLEVPDTFWHLLPNDTENTYREEDRYNESPSAVKRRRTSHGITETDSTGADSTIPAAVSDNTSGLLSPRTTPGIGGVKLSPVTRANLHGPFLDESDSEDDRDSSLITDTRESTRQGTLLKGQDLTSPCTPQLAACSVPATELLGEEDSNGFSFQADNDLERGGKAIDSSHSASNKQKLYPVAVEDVGGELSKAFSDEAAVCPICQTSLGGLSDSEASLHVNNCLDGNPNSAIAAAKDNQFSQQPPHILSSMKRKTAPRPGQKNPFSLDSASLPTSAFTKIMSGNEEDTAWSVASAREEASRGRQAYERTCPFYKILPGFSITVDAFKYGAIEGCSAYFLSHYHSDHYGGLTSSWSHGPIYCSKITANLVKQQIKVSPDMVFELEFEKRTEIPGTDGVSVTMITANHCPGSSLFLFEKSIGNGKAARVHRILHCGDFRACSAHINHPLLRPDIKDPHTGQLTQQKIDVCYLDTTYLNPKYAFPFQQDVIDACAQMCAGINEGFSDTFGAGKGQAMSGSMAPFLQRSKNSGRTSAEGQRDRGKLLVVIGTYSIGKERICLGVARALNSKIYVSPSKKRVCTCLEDDELSSVLTTDPLEAQVHMHSLMDMRSETLSEYLNSLKSHFSRIIGIRPTGWSYRPRGGTWADNPTVSSVLHSEAWKPRFSVSDLVPQRGSTKEAACFSVPYSEHSSFRELTMFCCALRISRIIPTVNVGNPKSREKMKYWIDKWEVERRKNGLYKIEDDDIRW